MDRIDALTVAGHVESAVALREETPFRRKFSMIYDTRCSFLPGCTTRAPRHEFLMEID